MASTKIVILEALQGLLEGDFKDFKWRLSNSDAPIPQGKLESKDRHDVVDLMMQRYDTDAGKIAVRTLCAIKQNELAKRLQGNLQKVPEDVPAGAGASSSETPVPAQPAGATVNISSNNGGTVKAPVVHGCNFTGPVTFN
ncbi:caspase b [Rhinichthys klamathensis goyatoka]|uniref:caspase b n=1 Tax=Rhinichthys klamathensis goyatoka TaxID=3034132 RepID=UPI0024B58DAA|nr:caspase b [Rhinichthys klamathensis goyatoka]